MKRLGVPFLFGAALSLALLGCSPATAAPVTTPVPSKTAHSERSGTYLTLDEARTPSDASEADTSDASEIYVEVTRAGKNLSRQRVDAPTFIAVPGSNWRCAYQAPIRSVVEANQQKRLILRLQCEFAAQGPHGMVEVGHDCPVTRDDLVAEIRHNGGNRTGAFIGLAERSEEREAEWGVGLFCEPGPPQWKLFKSDEGRFRVLLPETPTLTHETQVTAAGPVERYDHKVQVDDLFFLVAYEDFPAAAVRRADPDVVLLSAEKGMVEHGGGSLRSSVAITVDGSPGRDISITADQGLEMAARLILVGARLYIVMVVAPGRAQVTRLRDRFFKSLVIDN